MLNKLCRALLLLRLLLLLIFLSRKIRMSGGIDVCRGLSESALRLRDHSRLRRRCRGVLHLQRKTAAIASTAVCARHMKLAAEA
jgi:hypothetical protein